MNPGVVKMKSPYSKEEVQKILAENDFEYHRVNLPYGLSTPGADRSTTFNKIFPESLDSKSVLDIGCANGFFSFEAESHGASRVVGVELREKRFQHALLLKKILNSDVEFTKMNILDDIANEKFDIVLLLNVIHHIKEPMRALRNLSAITNEKLIIEFPTFSDPKYKAHTSIKFPFIYNRLPLIGVSSMDRKTDQTFVYSPIAIKKILLDHDNLFTNISITDSPMGGGRKIAICTK